MHKNRLNFRNVITIAICLVGSVTAFAQNEKVNRDAFILQLPVDGERYYEQKVESSPYFVKEKVLLLTGLVNPQVIRTAALLDIHAIIFVRGKSPSRDMIDMAEESDIILAGTKLPMFLSCGKLYEAGLRAGGTRAI